MVYANDYCTKAMPPIQLSFPIRKIAIFLDVDTPDKFPWKHIVEPYLLTLENIVLCFDILEQTVPSSKSRHFDLDGLYAANLHEVFSGTAYGIDGTVSMGRVVFSGTSATQSDNYIRYYYCRFREDLFEYLTATFTCYHPITGKFRRAERTGVVTMALWPRSFAQSLRENAVVAEEMENMGPIEVVDEVEQMEEMNRQSAERHRQSFELLRLA